MISSVQVLPARVKTGVQSKQRRVQTSLFLSMHAVVGLFLHQAPTLSTLHVYAVLALGLYWAATKSRIHAAYVAAYVVGTEVLWRMTGASFFWEGGKYTVALILALSLFREKKNRLPVSILFYFLLLLPSAYLTLNTLSLSAARDAISFNLSGPLALFISAWFFSNLKMNSRELVYILLGVLAPILTTVTYTLSATFRASEIRWVNDSMFLTSGGFGPNQVSTIMGLGLVSLLILLLIGDKGRLLRFIWLASATAILIQGLLTFSRGGMLVAAIVSAILTLHFVRKRELRLRVFVLLLVASLILAFVVLPALNEFTQGFLETRFTDSDLTNRDIILLEELKLFQDNVLVGVGPGVGNTARRAAAHTEMTRLLAEHGLLGAMSLALLLVLTLQRYFAQGSVATKGIRLGWMLWALLIMTNAAMRLAAVSYIYGLAFAHFELDETAE